MSEFDINTDPTPNPTLTCVALTNDAKGSGCKGVRGTAHPFVSGWSGHGAHVLFTLKRMPRKLKNDLHDLIFL